MFHTSCDSCCTLCFRAPSTDFSVKAIVITKMYGHNSNLCVQLFVLRGNQCLFYFVQRISSWSWGYWRNCRQLLILGLLFSNSLLVLVSTLIVTQYFSYCVKKNQACLHLKSWYMYIEWKWVKFCVCVCCCWSKPERSWKRRPSNKVSRQSI
jgi:hypothetical protein